jgi:hypothetical protein
MNNMQHRPLSDEFLKSILSRCNSLKSDINALIKELREYRQVGESNGNVFEQSDWNKYPPAIGEKESCGNIGHKQNERIQLAELRSVSHS